MTTLFEQQGVQYKIQGDCKLPCVILQNDSNYKIDVRGKRHRWYFKEHHRVRVLGNKKHRISTMFFVSIFSLLHN